MTDLLYFASFALHYEATTLILLHFFGFVLPICPYFKQYLFGFCSGIYVEQIDEAAERDLDGIFTLQPWRKGWRRTPSCVDFLLNTPETF